MSYENVQNSFEGFNQDVFDGSLQDVSTDDAQHEIAEVVHNQSTGKQKRR